MANFIFPFTNLHELNLDWLVQIMKQLETELTQFVALNTIKYSNPFQWNITSQYAQNTLVIDPQDGTAYLSVRPVPQGVPITNTDYWTPVFSLQNFTDKLKAAITTAPQQENGQPATEDLPANSVFFVGDVLCTNPAAIPRTSLVVIGRNCVQVSVVDLISKQLNKLKTAITTAPQQENGQPATEDLPANSVFFVGDVLCTNPAAIPQTSLVVIGSNCVQVSVDDLISKLLNKLKTAITTAPQQENGQAATEDLPANSVFFVGDVLCTNPAAIPQTSLVVIGRNCVQVSVVDLISKLLNKISKLFNTPTGWYRKSDTSINMGFPPSVASDIHVYSPKDQTITITTGTHEGG